MLVGAILCLALAGCGDSQKETLADPNLPVDAGMDMADATICPAPCNEPDQGAPDQGVVPDGSSPPEGPAHLPMGESAPASAYTVVSGPLSVFDVLADGRIVGESGSGIQLFHADTVVDLGSDFGTLRGAHTVAGEHVVFTSDGVFALVGDELQPSPLNDSVQNIRRVTRTGASSMWMMNEETLFHWSDGTLRSISLDDMEIDWTTTHRAAGQYEGADALWVAHGRSLVALTTEGAWAFDWPEDIAWLAGNAQGIWVAHQNVISHRSHAGEWTQYQRPDGAIHAVGSPESDDIWISSGTELWQWTGDAIRSRTDAPAHGRLRLGDNGDAYLSDVMGVYRVSAGRLVLFEGLANGGRLLGETVVEIQPSTPDEVEEITVQIDGSEAMLLGPAPWTITLSASVLGPGQHDVLVNIRYADGQSITGELSFMGPPTWEADIHPLHETYCAACHGDGGSAHPMMTAEQWQIEIAAIMDDIETGRMPYGQPRLDDVLIQLVRDWRDSGFTEQ